MVKLLQKKVLLALMLTARTVVTCEPIPPELEDISPNSPYFEDDLSTSPSADIDNDDSNWLDADMDDNDSAWVDFEEFPDENLNLSDYDNNDTPTYDDHIKANVQLDQSDSLSSNEPLAF